MALNDGTIGSDFRRKWIVTNTLGLGASMAIFAAIAEGMEQSGVLGSAELAEKVGHIVGLAIAGALLGAAQRRVMRQYGAGSGWAVVGAIVGLLLGYIGGYELGGFPFDYLLAPTLAALLSGVAQWAGLRRQLPRAGWWVAASTFGFLLGSVVAVAIAFLGLGEAIGGNYLGWVALNGIISAVNGAIGAAIGASVLLRLARRSTPSEQPAPLVSHAR